MFRCRSVQIVALLTNDAACAARKDGFREKLERLCPKRAAEIAFTATLSGTRGAAQEYMYVRQLSTSFSTSVLT